MLADKKKRRKTKEDPVEGNIWKPTQEEEEIARYLHRKLPSIEGKLSGVYVNVFNAEEAIDLLLNSPWARIELDIKKQKPRVFHSRVSAISFMQKLMDKRMFQKAIIVKKPKEEKKTQSKSKKADEPSKPLSAGAPNEVINIPPKDASDSKLIEDTSDLPKVIKSGSSLKDKSDLNKRNRLKFVPEQVFTVAESPSGSGCGNGFGSGPGEQYCYVWLYEPPPGLFNWLAGAGLLIGIILCCLFPLWPPQLRLLAYYLLLVASGLLGLILLIALVRAVVFAFVYLATLGRRRFWLLPNFFADCGFKDSFKPAWSCTIINPNNNLSSSTDASGSSTDKSPQFLTDEIGTGCQEIQYPSDKKTD